MYRVRFVRAQSDAILFDHFIHDINDLDHAIYAFLNADPSAARDEFDIQVRKAQ